MQRVAQLLIGLCLGISILTIPSNLFYKVYEGYSYINGLQIDYLIWKIYILECLLVLIAFFITLLYAKVIWKNLICVNIAIKKYLIMGLNLLRSNLRVDALNQPVLLPVTTLLVLVVVLVTNISFNPIWLPQLIHLCLILLSLYCYALCYESTEAHTKRIVVIFSSAVSILIQAAIAVFQFVYQRSVFPYPILGETDLHSYTGLARAQWWRTEVVLPYGTTPHPNILAGSVVLLLILLDYNMNAVKKKELRLLHKITLFLVIIICVLTQSLAASIALLIHLVTQHGTQIDNSARNAVPSGLLKKIILVLVAAVLIIVPVFTAALANSPAASDSITRRAYLNTAAISIWLEHPFVGVGFGNFSSHVEQFTLGNEAARFAQPVHHIGLLWLAETGLVGMLLLLIGLYLCWRNHTQTPTQLYLLLLSLTPILAWDHYLLTFIPMWWLIGLLVLSSVQFDRK